jgi:iron only hydrogenase large subunit-like protein
LAEIKIKSKKCKVCGGSFTPKRSTLEQVCSIDCAIILGKSKVKKEVLANNKKETSILREKLKTLSEWKKDLQVEINSIVREIDKGWPCIATNSFDGKKNAGHYISVGSNQTLRFHLENIFIQSEHSNSWKSGDTIRYQEGIKKTFGVDYMEYMNGLQQIQPIQLTINDVKEKIPIARGLLKWLKLQDRKFTTEERISLRKEFNNQLGIYEKTN